MDRQLEDQPARENSSLDRSADVHRFQRCAGRAISDLSKAMGAHLYKEKVLPLCWKRSGLATDPWHPVVPDAETPRQKTECSTLSSERFVDYERVFRKFLQMLGMKWVSPIQVGFRSGLDELEFIKVTLYE